ncbi:MAG: hypothetical protein NTZ84_02840 [Candidatus Nealsonbacteria bacterium]|nr:hypothetical protein [Candidatus Nealsonbacteria bacterium]
MSKTVDRRIINDLVAKGVESYKKKIKNGPSADHKHTVPEMAQACLVCKSISRPYCTPKFTEPVSPCAARNMILNIVKVRISF